MLVDATSVIYANPCFENFTEFTARELKGNATPCFASAQERSAFFGFVRKHLFEDRGYRALGKREALVHLNAKHSGQMLALVTLYPYDVVEGEGTSPRRCYCFFQDVVSWRSVLASGDSLITQPFKLALECNGDGPEADLEILRVNSTFASVLNCSPEELVGRRARDVGVFINSSDLQKLCSGMTRESIIRPLNVLGKSMVATLSILGRNLAGKRIFVLMCEEVNNMSTCDLELLLNQSKHLVEAQRLFFARVAHDIRTPVSSMIGIAGLLRNTALSKSEMDFVHTLQLCGDTVLSIVGDTLDFAALESGQLKLQMKPFDIVSTIENALDVMAYTAHAKNLELYYELESEVPGMVIGDEMRLKQVLVNILSNAVKFTKLGEVAVRLWTSFEPSKISNTSEHCCDLRISIHDTGIGIPDSQKGNIFGAFSQGDPSIARNFDGTGLGLFISKALVSAMGGTVSFDSKEGEGTTFYISLPHIGVLPPPTSERTATTRHPLPFATRTATVITKHTGHTRSLKQQLRFLGLRLVDTGTADVAFCDHDNQVTAPQRAQKHVVLRATDSPCNDIVPHLKKPVTRERLREVLVEVFPSLTESAAAVSLPCEPQQMRLHARVLVVDDSVIQRKVTEKLLESLGYPKLAIRLAGDGRSAIEALQHEKSDVILLDLHLPGLSGADTWREIQRLWGADAPKLVIVSGSVDQSATMELSSVYAQLAKPFRREDLWQLLCRVEETLLLH